MTEQVGGEILGVDYACHVVMSVQMDDEKMDEFAGNLGVFGKMLTTSTS